MEPLTAVIIGVLVFVVSQYVLKLVLEPVTQLRRTIADVSSTVLFRQPEIMGASFREDIAEELRRLASRIRADASLILLYAPLFRAGVFGVPSKDETLKACHQLNLLAYKAGEPSEEGRSRRARENYESLKELGRLLHMETMYLDRSN